MNKEEFITQLKQSISILDDQEQQYFVEEYTQHIDMKMSQGMSEEEAVKEMGPVKELSREILESYHVKTNVYGEQEAKGVDFNKFFRKIKGQADKTYNKIAAGCKKAGSGIKKLLTAFINLCLKPFKGDRTKAEAEGVHKVAADRDGFTERGVLADGDAPADKGISAETGVLTGTSAVPGREAALAGRKQSGFFFGIGGLIKGCFRGIMKLVKGCFKGAAWLAAKCVYLALWGLLIMWNMFCVFAGLVGIFFTAVFVFFTGLFLVMLTQGYPVAGFTLCAFGASVSAGTLVAGCFVLVRWKITKEEKPEGGEANA